MPTLRIRVTLTDFEDAIWRELLVPANLPLPELHHVLQAAMGWHDAHLHHFALGTDPWRAIRRWVAEPGDNPSDRPEDEATVTDLLRKAGDVATYLYDFGDDWDHRLTVTEVIPDGDAFRSSRPTLVAGRERARRRTPGERRGTPRSWRLSRGTPIRASCRSTPRMPSATSSTAWTSLPSVRR